MKNKRVVIRLTGGLGNQLHQYAYGCLVAKKINADLYLDVQFLINYSNKLKITKRDIELNKFDLNLKYKYYKSIFSNHLFLRIIKKIKLISFILEIFKTTVVTKHKPIDELNLKKWDFIYVDGIIGNFDDYKNDVEYLRDVLKINKEFDELVQIIENKVKTKESVAIHVRRSDYIKEGSIHHVLDMDYYLKAIEFFENQFENPVFYVFSDDREFIEKTFKAKNIRILEYSGLNPDFFDFLSIKNCNNQIIANSTFSWWAAFLNGSQNGKIIAPSVFLKTEELDIKLTYPENWIVI